VVSVEGDEVLVDDTFAVFDRVVGSITFFEPTE
jgi:hypothetical protein